MIRGKKMPGRLGGKFRTTHNLLVFRVVPELNMIAVVGHVPGAENGIVEVWDSNKKWKEPLPPPPFPAYIRKPTDVIKVRTSWLFCFSFCFKDYSEFPDGYKFVDFKGPMPMPWRLQVAQQAGWHIPSPQEVEETVRRGKIYHIAAGTEDEAPPEEADDEK